MVVLLRTRPVVMLNLVLGVNQGCVLAIVVQQDWVDGDWLQVGIRDWPEGELVLLLPSSQRCKR